MQRCSNQTSKQNTLPSLPGIFEKYQLTWILLLILAPSGLHSPPDSLTSSLCSLHTLVQLYGSSPSGPGKHSFPFFADPVPSGWEVLPLALPSLLTPCQLIRGLITWKAFFAGGSSPTLARFPLVIQASAIVRGLLFCGHIFFHRLRAFGGLDASDCCSSLSHTPGPVPARVHA